jgi:hypothetical protein
MGIDDALIADLIAHGYHPRTSKHSDLQSDLLIDDLVSQCPLLRERAAKGEAVAKLRHHQTVGHDDWVIDIAIGTCAGVPILPKAEETIRRTAPALIQIAIELKSIYTEHKKARKNRLRDFNAFHSYAHAYDPKVVAAAFLLINASEWFYSPLRPATEITRHGGPKVPVRRLVEDTLGTFRTIPLRNSATDPPGLEAIGVIVIEHDNLAHHPQAREHMARYRPSRVMTDLPAPRVGDPMHYETMIQRICRHYTERFR